MRRVDGHALKAHLRRGWFSGRRGRGPVYRPRPGRRPGCRAGLRAKPLAGGGPARRGNTCLRDERPAASTAARLSLEARRAGLVRDGVGEVAEVYLGAQRTVRGRSAGAAVPLQALRGRPRRAGDPQGPARVDGAAGDTRVPDPRAAPAGRADGGTGSRVVWLRTRRAGGVQLRWRAYLGRRRAGGADRTLRLEGVVLRVGCARARRVRAVRARLGRSRKQAAGEQRRGLEPRWLRRQPGPARTGGG